MNPLLQDADPDGRCLIRALHEFKMEDVNGSHTCVVSEVAGPSIANFQGVMNPILPKDASREIGRQVLLGLGALHARGLGHGSMLLFVFLFLDGGLLMLVV